MVQTPTEMQALSLSLSLSLVPSCGSQQFGGTFASPALPPVGNPFPRDNTAMIQYTSNILDIPLSADIGTH